MALGDRMPYTAAMAPFDLAARNDNNAVTGLMVSNRGRYVWSDAPFTFEITRQGLKTTPELTPVEAGSTLRDAYLAASKAHFPPSGTLPDTLFFSQAQWNTWIELQYDQTQEAILSYARDIIGRGFEPGVLMIDDNWQKYYGNFEFKPDRFPDPKAMVDELHALGFRVMLWVCPFVSPDSEEFRMLRAKGWLLRDIMPWWNGWSACYDMANPEAAAHFTAQLRTMQRDYGIDGFKFDGGDNSFYYPALGNRSVEQTRAWMELGLQFPFNEYRAGWQMGGQPLVMRLGDKNHSWQHLQSLIPEMTAAGLLGYAYTCPDMIGGGQVASFGAGAKADQQLIVRSAQVHALMPMMQFSVAPWRVLSAENLALVREAAALHSQLGPYILECARHAAATGEPIIRHMEYQFPDEGFAEYRDQFMLGPRIMAAPVVTAGDERTVRLPRGRWRDDQGKTHRGGRTITIDAPMGRIPYYERL
jgi:alpha-glucosidase